MARRDVQKNDQQLRGAGSFGLPRSELAIHHELDDELGDDVDVGFDALGLQELKRHHRA